MKLKQVSAIAKTQSIHPGKLSKTELVKTIQKSEGNFDCYATAYGGACDQAGCSWREDCYEASNGGEPS